MKKRKSLRVFIDEDGIWTENEFDELNDPDEFLIKKIKRKKLPKKRL